MILQAISRDFANDSNFTELKNFTIALNVFVIVDSQIWNILLLNFMFH